MKDPPKAIKRLLLEQLAVAYEEELHRALVPLAEAFDEWRRGQVTSRELAERIHAFHEGPAQDLWKKYEEGSPELLLGYAITNGILSREGLPPKLRKHLESAIRFHEGPAYRFPWDPE